MSYSVQKIDTKYFAEAISKLDEAVDTFNGALDTVKDQTQKLQSSWDGKGADKFDDAYKRLKREFDDQAENLTAIRDDLKEILRAYEAWDKEMKSGIAENSAGS